MTLDVGILALITFIVSLIWLEKGRLPHFLRQMSMMRCLVVSLIGMLFGMGLAMLTHLLYFPVISAILMAQLVAWKSRKHLNSVIEK